MENNITIDLGNAVEQQSRKFLRDILSEAISNSIQAGADYIQCLIEGENYDIIKITDNGVGFTQENTNSFKTCYSTYKKEKFGSKGIGRLTFLYLYRDVEIISTFYENGTWNSKKIQFNQIGIQETTLNIKEEKAETIVKLSGYRKERKGYQITLEKTISFLRSHLIPMLILSDKKILIKIEYPLKKEEYFISSDDIPQNIEDIRFSLKEGKKDIEFNLQIALNKSKEIKTSICEAYYVAGYRTVEKISEIPTLKGYDLYVLLSSSLFDDHVNSSRNKIELQENDNKDNIFLTLNVIADKTRQELKTFIEKNYPNILEESNKAKDKVIAENPHLAKYISQNNEISDESQIYKKAAASYEKEKKDVKEIRKHLKDKINEKNNSISDAELDNVLDKTIDLGVKLLAEYINERQSIINVLSLFEGKRETVEEKFHNLIMPRKREDGAYNGEIIPLKNNNLWLLDDRFMTYNYAASDIAIKKILSESNSFERPDLCVFFNSDTNQDQSVIVEIKPPGDDVHAKQKGVSQLTSYAKEFKKQYKSQRQWYYLITEINDDYKEHLENNNFLPLFSHGVPMYYQEYPKLGTSIFVMSFDSIVRDAKARNQIFLDQFVKAHDQINS